MWNRKQKKTNRTGCWQAHTQLSKQIQEKVLVSKGKNSQKPGPQTHEDPCLPSKSQRWRPRCMTSCGHGGLISEGLGEGQGGRAQGSRLKGLRAALRLLWKAAPAPICPHLSLKGTMFLCRQSLFSLLTKISHIWEGRLLPMTEKVTLAGWSWAQLLGSNTASREGRPQAQAISPHGRWPRDNSPSVEVAAGRSLRLHQQVSPQATLTLINAKHKHHHGSRDCKKGAKVGNYNGTKQICAHFN